MILLQVKRRVHILPEKSRVLMPPCEELRVHIESLDKKGAIDQPPVPEKYMSRPEGNPKKDEDPRKDPSTQMCSRSRQKSFLPDTRCPDIQRRMKKIPGRIKIPRRIQAPQMCARNRQKSFLPEKNLQAEMSRSLSRTHVDRVTITKLFRRRLSADKCRGIPMWIGQSSQVIPRPFCPRRGQTDILQGSGCGEDHGFPPGVRITHPRGLSVVSSSAAATRRGFVPRQTPVKRKFSEEKIDNTDKNVCNQCHQAY